MHSLLTSASAAAIPVHVVSAATWPALQDKLSPANRSFALAQGFAARAGQHCLLPDPQGALAAVLLGIDAATRRADPFAPGRLAATLPAGDYLLSGEIGDPALATLSWLLQGYRFDRYRKPSLVRARLVVPDGVDGEEISQIADSAMLARDLVNTPANELGPGEIEAAIRGLATECGATVASVVGDDLIARNFPMIHTVGRASTRAPRLVDLAWGDPSHPKVTLVGKGVAFDTGGLNLKPDASMLLMKKDMGARRPRSRQRG